MTPARQRGGWVGKGGLWAVCICYSSSKISEAFLQMLSLNYRILQQLPPTNNAMLVCLLLKVQDKKCLFT